MPYARAVAIASRHNARPGGRAGGTDVVIGKSHAFGIKFVEVGRLDDVIAVASKIAIALIIGNYKDYVGRRHRYEDSFQDSSGATYSGEYLKQR